MICDFVVRVIEVLTFLYVLFVVFTLTVVQAYVLTDTVKVVYEEYAKWTHR